MIGLKYIFGNNRNRTDNFMLAKHTLYQLSYTPNLLSKDGKIELIKLKSNSTKELITCISFFTNWYNYFLSCILVQN